MADDYFWVAEGAGDWDVATNWEPAHIPTPGSFVVIAGPSATHNLAHKDSIQNLELDSATLSMAAGSLTMREIQLDDAGIVVTGGSLTAQTIVFADSLNIHVNGGALSLGHGEINLRPGQEIAIGALGTLTLKGVTITDDAYINDAPFSLPLSHVVNDGTFHSNGQTIIETNFTNNDAVQIDGGHLKIFGSSDDGGTYAGAGGATLHLGAFVSGYHVTSADSMRTIAGTVEVPHVIEEGADVTFNGVYFANTTEASVLPYLYFDGEFAIHYAGSMTFNAGYESDKTKVDPGGTMVFNEDSSTGSLVVKGGVIDIGPGVVEGEYRDGTVVANDILAVHGATTLQGASLGGSGTIVLEGATQITKDLNFQPAELTLENHGVMSFSGKPSVSFTDSAAGHTVFLNASDGIINDRADMKMTELNLGAVPASYIDNEGLFEKTGGNGTTEIDIPFVNNGTIEVDRGTLWLKGGLTGSGDVILNGGTLLIGPGATPFADAFADHLISSFAAEPHTHPGSEFLL